MDKRKYIVFLDFDNTITTCDVFDSLIMHFSKDKRWMELEEKWKTGEIGSRECLSGQIKGVKISRQALDKHLSKIKLDPYFKRLIKLLDAKKIRVMILSDNFDYILRRILKDNGIKNLKIYSNKLKVNKNGLIPRFPFKHKSCPACAHCKTNNVLPFTKNCATTVYVGDGLSDTCPAKYTDIVFAKDGLLEYCKKNKIKHIPYKGLKEIYAYFKDPSL